MLQQFVALPAFKLARGSCFVEVDIEIILSNFESSLYIYAHSSLHRERERERVREREDRDREKRRRRERYLGDEYL